MSSVEFDGTCIGPTAGDLVPGSRRVEKKKKKEPDGKSDLGLCISTLARYEF